MNAATSQKSSGLIRLFLNFLHKITERPDFYPIKYYHKKRRTKHSWHTL